MTQQSPNGETTTRELPEEQDWLAMQSGHSQETGDDYPLLIWLNGNQELQQLGGVSAYGGFMFKFDQDPDFPVGKLTEKVTGSVTEKYDTSQTSEVKGAQTTIVRRPTTCPASSTLTIRPTARWRASVCSLVELNPSIRAVRPATGTIQASKGAS
mgnify:CR=1 FL=1